MTRVLPPAPYEHLDDYRRHGGGRGLEAARAVEPGVVIAEVEASGLRGRGGAGFPTGTKWRTVRSYASPVLATSVVVNAAEGEPGTFKDRAILRANPYAVIEGALIAAHAVEARTAIVAIKGTFTREIGRLRAAIDEVRAAGWAGDVDLRIVEGPSEYLFGEETALLEVIDGRPPFPRIAPPYRRGVVEVVGSEDDVTSGSGLAAEVQMATADDVTAAPPVLVNNVETMANVPAIIARGAAWFRDVGTAESPGSIVVTVTGAVRSAGLIEVPMGTTLREVIDAADGIAEDQGLGAVLAGVSGPVLTNDELDTPLTYEGMAAIGHGLGSAGFIVIGTGDDPVSVAAGVSRFLAVESCGQCTPCKRDGLEIAERLARLATGDGDADDLAHVDKRLTTVADGARCSLARQHEAVVGSLVRVYRRRFEAATEADAPAVGVTLVAALAEIDETGAVLDAGFATKQPDWSHDDATSGKTPVERFTDHRAHESPR